MDTEFEDILNKEDDFIIVVKENPNDTLIKLMQDIWNNEKIFCKRNECAV